MGLTCIRKYIRNIKGFFLKLSPFLLRKCIILCLIQYFIDIVVVIKKNVLDKNNYFDRHLPIYLRNIIKTRGQRGPGDAILTGYMSC